MNTGATFTFGWTLLHFLWQGTAVALAVWMVLGLARRARPETRYLVAWAGLALMAAAPVATYLVLRRSEPSARVFQTPPTTPPSEQAGLTPDREGRIQWAAPPSAFPATTLRGRLDRVAPHLLPLWCLGVLILGLRMAGGLGWLAQARKRSHAVEGIWAERVEVLRRHFGVLHAVTLRTLDGIDGPLVAGIFKPVILVPSSLLTGLPATQVELLLAHEMAHLARHDVILNALQRVLETLLFFHPAVWWLGRRVRQERERCCDAMAADVLGDPCGMAEALTSLAGLQVSILPTFALGAGEGSLSERVHALLDFHAPVHRWRMMVAGGLLLVCVGTGIGLWRWRARRLGLPTLAMKDQAGYLKLVRSAEGLQVEFEVRGASADDVLRAFAEAEGRLQSRSGHDSTPIQRGPGKSEELHTIYTQSLSRPAFLEYLYRLKARPALDCPPDTLVVRRDNLGLPWDRAEDPPLDVWVPKYANQFSPEAARLLREALLELRGQSPTPGLPQEVRRKLPETTLATLKSPEAGQPILRAWFHRDEEELIRACHEDPYETEGGFRYELNRLNLELRLPVDGERKALASVEEGLEKTRSLLRTPKFRRRSQSGPELQERKALVDQERRLSAQRESLEADLLRKGFQGAFQQIRQRLSNLDDREALPVSKGRTKITLDIALPRESPEKAQACLQAGGLKIDPALLKQNPKKEVEILRQIATELQARLERIQQAASTHGAIRTDQPTKKT